MPIRYINGKRIYYAVLAGAREVTRNRTQINKINVFPVYDSDTGNNMAATLNYIVDTVNPSRYAFETIHSLADASLSGARGNSGIIMAQFINGLSVDIGRQERLSTKAFGRSVVRAVPYAYSAVTNPVEGTLLTVLKDWAGAVQRLSEETNDFVHMLGESVKHAQQSLKETPEKLLLLKDAAVVDAGALGFVLFLEGVARLMQTGDLREILRDKAPPVGFEEPLEGITGDIDLRYCSEALITGSEIDHSRMRQACEQHGDSLIIAGTERKAKVHIHTNHPEDFFFELLDHGTIVDQKVDDMLRQYQAVHQRISNIALVTDSIADLPRDILDQYQVHMVPINLEIDGSNFLDKVSVRPSQIFSILDSVDEYPTSSQPSYNAAQQHLSFICNHYESVIAITVSKELSGTWNVLNSVAETLRERGKKISVINSKTNSGAQGLLVLKAARMIVEGRGHDEIVRDIEQSIPDTKIFVSVATFNLAYSRER